MVDSGSSGRREKKCRMTATGRTAASTTLASYMIMLCEWQWIVADASALAADGSRMYRWAEVPHARSLRE